jgi:hypothetical protein
MMTMTTTPMATAECHCAGVVAHTALALSPFSCWHLWHVFVLVAMVYSLSLSCCHCCHSCAGIVALIVLALLPLLRWHCCRSCACVIALIALALSLLASLPSLHRHFHHHCSGTANVTALHLCCQSMDVLTDACCSGRGMMLSSWLRG